MPCWCTTPLEEVAKRTQGLSPPRRPPGARGRIVPIPKVARNAVVSRGAVRRPPGACRDRVGEEGSLPSTAQPRADPDRRRSADRPSIRRGGLREQPGVPHPIGRNQGSPSLAEAARLHAAASSWRGVVAVRPHLPCGEQANLAGLAAIVPRPPTRRCRPTGYGLRSSTTWPATGERHGSCGSSRSRRR